jgi:hypothetical protein
VRTYLSAAALILGGALFIGCDSKDNTTPTTPPVTPPAVKVPDTSKVADAAKNATDAAQNGIKDVTDATKAGINDAADAAKKERAKLMPATMPTMPDMPK